MAKHLTGSSPFVILGHLKRTVILSASEESYTRDQLAVSLSIIQDPSLSLRMTGWLR